MLLTITPAGLTLETNALQNGTAIPKIKEFVIDSGVSVDGFSVHTESYKTPVLAFERLSAGVLKFHGEIPPTIETMVKGIAIRLEDNTIYAYGRYQEQSGGFFKGKSFAFTFFVLHSREQNAVLAFAYSPLNINDIAEQIAIDAKTNMDLYLEGYFIATALNIARLDSIVLKMLNELNQLRKG